MSRRKSLKRRRVITNGHRQGKQLLQRFRRLPELHGDPSGLNTHAGRKAIEVLIANRSRSLDEQWRTIYQPLSHLVDRLGDLPPADIFIAGIIAACDSAKVTDQAAPVRETVRAHAVGNTRSHDLLGPSRSYAEQKLNRPAINPGVGKSFEVRNDLV